MDSILDFFRAASPWVAMGLLLAIFFVRSAVKKKKGKKQDGDSGTGRVLRDLLCKNAGSKKAWNPNAASRTQERKIHPYS